jgi:hypothetical protein
MPRIGHGGAISLERLRMARETLSALTADVPAAFAAIRPVDTRDFDFLFRDLQDEPGNLLPERRRTRNDLVHLGRTMQDTGGPLVVETPAYRLPTRTSGSSSTTTSRSRRTPPTCLICWTTTSHRSDDQR